jgi:peptidoglycan/xylan/chitin deacetylase (PgdA/CDA1 family)
MQKGNIVFGAHTITHKILSEVDRETALSEISGSKSALEEILREKVKYFAYPKGKRRDFTEATMEMVNEAGYVAAFSTENGRISHNSNVFALNRIGMRDYPLFVFKVRVSGIFENRCLHMLRRFIGLI